jgi:uncharacterized YccA/Bax inhibitor family protein
MSAAPEKKPPVWNAIFGILCLVLGGYSFSFARCDAARQVVRHGSYKTGYAPIYAWQEFAFSIVMLTIGVLLLYSYIRRFTLDRNHGRGNRHDATPITDTTKET